MNRIARTQRTPVWVIATAALFLGLGLGLALSQTIPVPVEVAVVAQRHENGAVEVGVEQGGERYLPNSRFVSPNAEAGRWLRASPVMISVDVPEPEPVETFVEVPVEVRVEVPVEPPVVRLSVRPSDHPGGFVCLEEANEEGHTWTWGDSQDPEEDEGDADESGSDIGSYSIEFGVFVFGVQRGWSVALRNHNLSPDSWLEHDIQAAWHEQCAAYHGVVLVDSKEYITDPDHWIQQFSEENE